MIYKVTKTFENLPCAHEQWFDVDDQGGPGPCASFHGYSRSVKIVLVGDVDQNGWVFGFGHFDQVKKFLEYYFDHTSLASPNDPRLEALKAAQQSGILGTLRMLPYGVGMEQTARFLWEQINPYIFQVTEGRVTIEEIEVRENSKNSGSIHLTRKESEIQAESVSDYLVMKPFWDFIPPA